MKGKLFLAVIILALLASACAGAATMTPAPAPLAPEKAAGADYGATGESVVALPQAEERLIVRTGNISMVVEDTEVALAHIEALAAQLGGYVADSNSWREHEQLHATITIRVPAEDFDEARRRIKEEALEEQGENTSAQDVTEEYTDLEARLKNLQATEAELRELLASVREKTQKAEDILAVYRELTAIRGEIEQIQGRMQYLEHSAALAALTVTLTPKEVIPLVEKGWSWTRTLRDSVRNLVTALQFLVDLATRIVIIILPILIILAIPFLVLWGLWQLWRRRKAKKAE